MNKFDYHSGKHKLTNTEDEDVEELEREIESIMKRKVVESAEGGLRRSLDHKIINMKTSNFRIGNRTKTEAQIKRRKIMKPVSMSATKDKLAGTMQLQIEGLIPENRFK